MRTLRARFKTLGPNGHDEGEFEGLAAIEKEFNSLVSRGYALFVNEVQAQEIADLERLWGDLEGTEPIEVLAVPPLRGGLIS